MIMAYTVDLNLVLKSTFKFMQKSKLMQQSKLMQKFKLMREYSPMQESKLMQKLMQEPKSDLTGPMNWEVLKEAFKDYSHDVRRIHNSCRSILQWNNQDVDRDAKFRDKIREMFRED